SVLWREHTADGRLAWYIIVATIPAGLAALAFGDLIEEHSRSIFVIMLTTIIFGLWLGWADYRGQRTLELTEMTFYMALWIGAAQALALIPGTSRSGVTLTMALVLGMQREAGARFSFLLSIPIILLSGVYKGVELASADTILWKDLLLGAAISGVSA